MENKEKYIVERIKDHREEVDMNALWGSIADDIPQPKKKRRGFFWLFFGALVLIGFGMVTMTNSPKEKTLLAPKTSLLEKNEANTNTIENLSNTIKEISSRNQANSNHSRPSSKSKETITQESTSFNPIQSVKELNKSNSKANVPQASITREPNAVEMQKESNSMGLFLNLSEMKAKDEKSIDDAFTSVNPPSIAQSSLAKVGRIISIPYLFSAAIEPLDFSRALELSLPVSSPIVDLKNDHGRTNPWSIYANSGISYLTRELTSVGSDMTKERDRRMATEKVHGGWNAHLGLGYRWSSNLSLQVGLGVAQIHEVAEFTTNYIVTQETTGTVSTTYLQNGEVITQEGSIETKVDRLTNEKRYNTLRFYSVPVSASYIIAKKRSYGVAVSALASYSFSQKYDGVVSFDSVQESYSLSEDRLDRFSPSGAVTFGAGISVFRNISSAMRLNAGLDFRRISGINNASYLIDQKYNSITFSVGVSRQL